MTPGVITSRGKGLYYQQTFILTLRLQDDGFYKMLTGDMIHNMSFLELRLAKTKGLK